MDKKIIIANWKSHKTQKEVNEFFLTLKEHLGEVKLANKEIIIAPPFPYLMLSLELINSYNLDVKLAGQTISSYPEGAYTGEVNAKQIKEFCEYVIVGHSERRKYMHESENDIDNKIAMAKEVGLQVIQCIQDENSQIHKNTDIIAYEPPNAISTFGVGEAESPEEIEKVFSVLKDSSGVRPLLYGGSVTKENIISYVKIDSCKGFLVGGASLLPDSFIQLLLKW